jgi:acyl phosphate:glycerol-3-phosphate acyltransferase
MKIILIFLIFLINYFIGSFSPSIFFYQKKYKIDPRKIGSKNAGATNVWRTKRNISLTAFIFLFDIFKMVFSIVLNYFLLKKITDFYLFYDLRKLYVHYLLGFGVIIGHIYPIYHDFKGGKGVASFFGLFLTINPISFGFMMVIYWWFAFKFTKKHGIASLISIILINVNFLLFLNNSCNFKPLLRLNNECEFLSYYLLLIIVWLITILIFEKHKKNIINYLLN